MPIVLSSDFAATNETRYKRVALLYVHRTRFGVRVLRLVRVAETLIP